MAARTSKPPVSYDITPQHQNPENHNLNIHHSENPKPLIKRRLLDKILYDVNNGIP
jgi:hypothetical protein